MGRGEQVDARGTAYVGEPRPLLPDRRARRGAKRQPASAAASPCTMPTRELADPRHAVHRQGGQAAPGAGGCARAAVRRRISFERLHDVVVNRLRIGAAAAGADVVGARDLGLDIAADARWARPAGRSRRTTGSASNQWKSPLNTIVGGVRSRAASPRSHRAPPGCRRARPRRRAYRPRSPAGDRTPRADSGSRAGTCGRRYPFPPAPKWGAAIFTPPPPSARRRSSSPARRCSRSNGRRRGSGCRRDRRR